VVSSDPGNSTERRRPAEAERDPDAVAGRLMGVQQGAIDR